MVVPTNFKFTIKNNEAYLSLIIYTSEHLKRHAKGVHYFKWLLVSYLHN
jgi:hypothetical protein